MKVTLATNIKYYSSDEDDKENEGSNPDEGGKGTDN